MKLFSKPTLCIYALMSLPLLVVEADAQSGIETRHYMQLNTVISNGDYAPYWITANRQGLLPVEKSSGYARYALLLDGTIGKEKYWKYSAGVDALAGYNRDRGFALHQIYANLSWKWLEFSIGKREYYAQMRDFCLPCSDIGLSGRTAFSSLYRNSFLDLGTGGLAYSGNSAPIPQFRIAIPEYVDFPGTNSWLKIKGHIAYGIFLDDNFQEDFTKLNPAARYARNVMYHSKALFMKLGKSERFPITAEGGLEMYSQFGGDFYTHEGGKYLSMPRGVKDFFKAFIPLSGDSGTPDTEQSNISGNHIGNWHLAFTLHTDPVDVRVYGEHMFDDFSQLFFFEYQSNLEGEDELVYYPWYDIQLGIAVKNKTGFLSFIKNIQYEYTSTYNQSGAGYNDPSDCYNEQMDGMDNYYNHSIYPGWHHYGMGIGNPLVISPMYNNNGSLTFRGNRLVAHNVGLNGAFANEKFLYRVMYTYSENWGTYHNPFSEKRYTTSLLADLLYIPKRSNWLFSLSLAYDKSNFIGDNVGAMLSVARALDF